MYIEGLNRKIIYIMVAIIVIAIVTLIGILLFKDRQDEVDKILGDIEKGVEQEDEDEFANERKYIVEINGEDVKVTQAEKDYLELQRGYDLTEEEEKTILSEKTGEVVDPLKQKEMIYFFYDRNKVGSGAAVEMLEDYVRDTGIPYTIYHMNDETGIVQGQVVLDKLGHWYEAGDENGIVFMKVRDGKDVLIQTEQTLNEEELRE